MKTQSTPQTFIDTEIKSVELSYVMGNHIVEITWNNDDDNSIIRFNKKGDAVYYYDWITNSPRHPMHKNNKELFV